METAAVRDPRVGRHAQVQNLPLGMHIWLGEEAGWVDEASFVP
jgi:hypothetical protein